MTDYTPDVADHFLLHISDTHFVGEGLLHGGVDSDKNLRTLLDSLAARQQNPEAIIFTGDLADAGEIEAYRRLKDMVEPVAAEMGAQVIWVMGNHDERGAFRSTLLGGEASSEPVDAVYDVNGLRIIALDSTVPGHHYGELTEEQISWLSDVLAQPAPHGTLLALHHPPVPSPIAMMKLVDLREQDRLAEVIQGSDVRGILAGHLHYSTFTDFAGVPVSVASATCYTQDLAIAQPGARGMDGGQSHNLVHVYGDKVMHSIVPLGDFATLYEMQADQMAAFLAMTPEQQVAAMAGSEA